MHHTTWLTLLVLITDSSVQATFQIPSPHRGSINLTLTQGSVQLPSSGTLSINHTANLTSHFQFGTKTTFDGTTIAVIKRLNNEVYIYQRKTPLSSWENTQTLTFPYPIIDISADNGRMAIANTPSYDPGFVWIYRRARNQTWVHETTLTNPDLGAGSHFAYTVALKNNTLLAAGAHRYYAYVFTYNGSNWVFIQVLTYTGLGSNFGQSLQSTAVSENLIVIGAPNDDVMYDRGAVYIFERLGNLWTQVGHLDGGGDDNHFGSAVAVQGDTIFVSALGESVLGVYSHGVVHACRRNSTGSWNANHCQRIFPRNISSSLESNLPFRYPSFGTSIALLHDHLLVGASGGIVNGMWPGKAFMFKLCGGIWVETMAFVAQVPSAAAHFGSTVRLSATDIVIAADSENQYQGAVYTSQLSLPAGCPTMTPTVTPVTSHPSGAPTSQPSDSPVTRSPSNHPSETPASASPSVNPTANPSWRPSLSPTRGPETSMPTGMPTETAVRRRPSGTPTLAPGTLEPSGSPSVAPATAVPSSFPSGDPSMTPSASPVTQIPSGMPTFQPTFQPSSSPLLMDLNPPCNASVVPLDRQGNVGMVLTRNSTHAVLVMTGPRSAWFAVGYGTKMIGSAALVYKSDDDIQIYNLKDKITPGIVALVRPRLVGVMKTDTLTKVCVVVNTAEIPSGFKETNSLIWARGRSHAFVYHGVDRGVHLTTVTRSRGGTHWRIGVGGLALFVVLMLVV